MAITNTSPILAANEKQAGKRPVIKMKMETMVARVSRQFIESRSFVVEVDFLVVKRCLFENDNRKQELAFRGRRIHSVVFVICSYNSHEISNILSSVNLPPLSN